MEPSCQIRVEAFEGPLDLLLHLIQKNEIDVSDIPIALITSQYLEYLEFMRALDIAVAGEYLVMAATLIHIKSRVLLPRPEPEDPEEDPRLEIARPLQELMLIREAARELERLPLLGRDVFTPVVDPPPRVDTAGEEDGVGGASGKRPLLGDLIGLIDALRTVVSARDLAEAIRVASARVSMEERMEFLEQELARRGRASMFDMVDWADIEAVIVTFLALLELVKRGRARIFQEAPGKDVLVLAAGSIPGLSPAMTGLP